jgi:hypothetical protein
MEVLFENSYVRNKKLAKELYWYIYFQRPIHIAINIIMILCFLVQMLLFVWNPYSSNIGYLIFVPLYFLLCLLRYTANVRVMTKRDKEINGSEISVTTIVTDEYIQSTLSNGGVNKLEYQNIKYAKKTKNLILLRSKAELIYIMQRDAFSVGTEDAFLMFLRDKGIKIK